MNFLDSFFVSLELLKESLQPYLFLYFMRLPVLNSLYFNANSIPAATNVSTKIPSASGVTGEGFWVNLPLTV